MPFDQSERLPRTAFRDPGCGWLMDLRNIHSRQLGEKFKHLPAPQTFAAGIAAQVHNLYHKVLSIADDKEINEVCQRFRVGCARSASTDEWLALASVFRQ